MIVKLKKVTMLCLQKEREPALEKLRGLGVMHLEILSKNDSDDRGAAEALRAGVEKAKNILSLRKTAGPVSPEHKKLSGQTLPDEALKNIARADELVQKLDALRKDHEKLLPWGDFSFASIERLAKEGITVTLRECDHKDFIKISGPWLTKLVGRVKNTCFFALVSKGPQDDPSLPPEAQLPRDKSLRQIEAEIKASKEELAAVSGNLDSLASMVPEMTKRQLELERDIEFLGARDAMGRSGDIAHIQGYIPERDTESLTAAARTNGWALLINDPGPEDNVPTLIDVPKIFRIANPIFKFIGVAPGYHEIDISVCFLFFFTIFFAMIIGDAGYGFVFLVLSLVARALVKDPRARLGIRLFITLSCATIVWGLLTGAVFGMPRESLPKCLQGLNTLTNPEFSDRHIQLICFTIAAVHLSLARFWRVILIINHKAALGELGWAMLIWANFFTAVELIVFPGVFPKLAIVLYVVGFIFLVAFSVKWSDLGEALNFPFALIGSFVDVLSYIRLYAVGLSGAYIASSFNDMGLMLLGLSPSRFVMAFMVIAMILLFVMAHTLNMGLSLISVLVHGIRLNTLEFSNHMGLQWTGFSFKPFKDEKPNN
jgi:V/A-type H+-transporting ATPase subunit I